MLAALNLRLCLLCSVMFLLLLMNCYLKSPGYKLYGAKLLVMLHTQSKSQLLHTIAAVA